MVSLGTDQDDQPATGEPTVVGVRYRFAKGDPAGRTFGSGRAESLAEEPKAPAGSQTTPRTASQLWAALAGRPRSRRHRHCTLLAATCTGASSVTSALYAASVPTLVVGGELRCPDLRIPGHDLFILDIEGQFTQSGESINRASASGVTADGAPLPKSNEAEVIADIVKSNE